MEQSKVQEYSELLKDAAKAAGHRIVEWATDGNGVEVAIIVRSDGDGFSKRPWQPLHENQMTDADGDALQLAVKLGEIGFFRLNFGAGAVSAENPAAKPLPFLYACEDMEELGSSAATRLAIVRAAAEIGGSKE